MIRRILIANRGEIALRIISTCQKMGIETVGVKMRNEPTPLHCSKSDYYVELNGDSLESSYLDSAALIEAAQSSNSDAIHPGYGFLSENPSFSRSVKEAGLIFIGPSADSLEQLGSKDKAREKASELNIPTVPGFNCGGKTDAEILSAAKEIGFPLLIKACAGGGGRGMRRVDSAKQFPEELKRSREEALSYFSNPDLIIEKLIIQPRHIEVQLLADAHGNVLHLFERDCSIQRRYQKVLEIAPAPGLDEKQLGQMYKDAVSITTAANLVGAATAEFLWDDAGKHYFLEVNPRIQVEHPVTEFITGLDIVELQIIAAEGKVLPIKQAQIKRKGSAIEARVYAEIPERNYMPGVGVLTYSSFPDTNSAFDFKNGVRFDLALTPGTVISTRFDPLLAKVICGSSDFESANALLTSTLEKTGIWGVGTNNAYLLNLLEQTRSQSPEKVDVESACSDKYLKSISKFAGAAGICLGYLKKARDPFFSSPFWRQLETDHRYSKNNLVPYSASCSNLSEDFLFSANLIDFAPETKCFRIRIDEELIELKLENDFLISGERKLKLGPQWLSKTEKSNPTVCLTLEGYTFQVSKRSAITSDNAEIENLDSELRAPLPGTIIAIPISKGQKVSKGEVLVVIESMKIEHHIRAPKDCIIETINVSIKDTVKTSQSLIELKD